MVSHSIPLAYRGIKPLMCHSNLMNPHKKGFIFIHTQKGKAKREGLNISLSHHMTIKKPYLTLLIKWGCFKGI